MKNQYFIFLFILIIPVSVCQGQTLFEDKNTVTGILYDEATGEPVPFANIFNESQRRWSLGKENGEFVVPVNPGDTLAVTSIGYLGRVIIADKNHVNKNLKVNLTPRQYDIDEIQVIGYRNYHDFKKAFKELEIDNSQAQQLSERLKIEGTKEAIEAAYNKNAEDKLSNPRFSTAIGTPVPSVKVIIDGLKKKDEIRYQNDLKFNREMVANLTQLKGDELTNFIGYCNFSQEYLQDATEYEIVDMIMKKLKSFRAVNDSTGEVVTDELWHLT